MLNYFSATKSFDIEISNCSLSDWLLTASDTIANVMTMACQDIPVHEYVVDQIARYVKFKATATYGYTAVLQYFYIHFDYPNGVMEEEFICPSRSYKKCF